MGNAKRGNNEAFEVLPGSLYYVAVANGTNTYNYGKLYVESVSTSTGATAAPGKGNKTVKAWFALQPTVGAIFAEMPYLASLGSLLR